MNQYNDNFVANTEYGELQFFWHNWEYYQYNQHIKSN